MNGREKVVAKNGPFSLTFSQIGRFDVAASQCVRGFVVGSPGKGRRRRAGEEEAAGVTVELARAVPLAGDSRRHLQKPARKQ